LGAPPVAEEATKTKRSGRQVRHAPSERNVGNRKRATSIPSAPAKKEDVRNDVFFFYFCIIMTTG